MDENVNADARYINRMRKAFSLAEKHWAGKSCNVDESEDAEDVNVFSKENMCKLNGQVNSALNSWARKFACAGGKNHSRKIIRMARKVRNFYDTKNNC